MNVNPKAFISYSHDSEKHKEWVRDLAENLRRHGVDVILDQWDLALGKDLRFFMEKGLSESKFVICVCSEDYVTKANRGSGGVGYETTIISGELIKDSTIDYILPIIKNNVGEPKTPCFLTNKLYADFDKGDYYQEYKKLLDRIYNEQDKAKPKLGNSPYCSTLANDICTKTSLEKSQFKNDEDSGIIEFDYSKNDGQFIIGDGSFLFVTKWSGCSSNMIYAYSDMVKHVGYKNDCTEFPKKNELDTFDYTSRVVRVPVDSIVVFLNQFGNFLTVKIIEIKSQTHGQKEDYLKFEYRILKNE